MKTVLYFQTAYRDPNRKRAEGVREYAAKAGWQLQTIPYGIHAVQPENDLSANVRTVRQMSALIAKFAPDGCLVEDSPSWDVFDAAVRDLPAVYVDRRRSRQGKGIAAEMLDELMDEGRRPGDRTFGAAGVVRRATTHCMRNPDALVADWLETIRLKRNKRPFLAKTGLTCCRVFPDYYCRVFPDAKSGLCYNE